MKKNYLAVLTVLAVLPAFAQQADQVGVGGGPSIRYATDAYPGFDNGADQIKPSRKEPRLMAWWNGPKYDNPEDQFAYAKALQQNEGNYSKAAKAYDALVREWPTAKDAVKAQMALADIRYFDDEDYEEAFEEYRYLLDFYSSRCDYNAVVDRLYEIAGKLREEGKTIMFFRFKNSTDVRRAYEACVLRAPGAKWAPEAMLIIGNIREDEEQYTEAVKVYENLRNLHFDTPEARAALAREAAVRMQILSDCGYNRERYQDTRGFLELALKNCDNKDRAELEGYLTEVKAAIEDAAYASAKFYDSNMRTRRSAINAYEQFLKEYPDGIHAEETKARLNELKGTEE